MGGGEGGGLGEQRFGGRAVEWRGEGHCGRPLRASRRSTSGTSPACLQVRPRRIACHILAAPPRGALPQGQGRWPPGTRCGCAFSRPAEPRRGLGSGGACTCALVKISQCLPPGLVLSIACSSVTLPFLGLTLLALSSCAPGFPAPAWLPVSLPSSILMKLRRTDATDALKLCGQHCARFFLLGVRVHGRECGGSEVPSEGSLLRPEDSQDRVCGFAAQMRSCSRLVSSPVRSRGQALNNRWRARQKLPRGAAPRYS
jgi:hypothetical protein